MAVGLRGLDGASRAPSLRPPQLPGAEFGSQQLGLLVTALVARVPERARAPPVADRCVAAPRNQPLHHLHRRLAHTRGWIDGWVDEWVDDWEDGWVVVVVVGGLEGDTMNDFVLFVHTSLLLFFFLQGLELL